MPPTEEDIAWFKSTFHPIPKPRLPDDCVEYCLYVFSSASLADDDLRTRLREIQKAAAQFQKEYLKDYIWQRQGFALELVKEDGEEVRMARIGRTVKNLLTVVVYRIEFVERTD